jgi:hypothetical protein
MMRFGFVLVVLAAGLAGGCGGGPKIAPVSGVVKMKDKPLAQVQVEFYPEGNGPRAVGETDAEGRFTLTTDTGKSGALVGVNRVVLRDLSVMKDEFLGRAAEGRDMSTGKKPRFVKPYDDPNTTTLKETVADGTNNFTIEVK